MKTCTRCGESKPEKDFAWRNKARGILQTWCRACYKAYDRERWENPAYRDQVMKRRLANRNKKRVKLTAYKLERGCAVCGYKRCAKALDLHHKRDKDKAISQMVNDDAYWSVIKAELRKCIVLCANCHRELHAGDC